MQCATEFGNKGPGCEYTYCGLLNILFNTGEQGELVDNSHVVVFVIGQQLVFL